MSLSIDWWNFISRVLTQPLLWIFFHQFSFLNLICRSLVQFILVLFPEQHKFEFRTWLILVTSTLKQVPVYRRGFPPRFVGFSSHSFSDGWRWRGRWRCSGDAAGGRRRAAVGAAETLKGAQKHQSSPLLSECCQSPFKRGPMSFVLSVLTKVYRQTLK